MRRGPVIIALFCSLLLVPLANAQILHQEVTTKPAKVAVFVFDGGGSDIPDGTALDSYIPANTTISGWTIVTPGTACSASIDLWNDSFTNYPPTVADKITASAAPSMTTTTHAKGLSTTWRKTIKADSFLRAIYTSGNCNGVVVLTVYGQN